MAVLAKSGGLPSQVVDSKQPMAREGFVLQAHFDAGNKALDLQGNHVPSTLWHGVERKPVFAPPILYANRHACLRVSLLFYLVWTLTSLKLRINVM